jgi:carbonic anhydrase/acetyltransferase-like protein (isoleucine patch superfamily)
MRSSGPPKSLRGKHETEEVLMLYDLGEHRVDFVAGAYFVAPSAAVIGRVTLGRDANVWFGAVLRGDTNTIVIGARSNVQDNAILHVDHDAPAHVGDEVTIGHAATVHGCRIGNRSLIGIGAIILSHAVIGENCIVGAGALITERKSFPDRSVIIGAPARRVREVSAAEMQMLADSAAHYVDNGRRYRAALTARGD